MMLGFINKLEKQSKFNKIVIILFAIFAVRVFGYTTSIGDLTFR